jgi:signal transduction histidine kinase
MAAPAAFAARGRSTGMRATVVAVVLVAAAFVTTTSFFLLRSRGIGEAAELLTRNAVPSIQELLAARSDVALVRVRVENYVGASANHASRTLVRTSVEQLRERVARYSALPSYPGERQLSAELLTSVDGFVGSVERVLEARDRGDVWTAEQLVEAELRPAADRLGRLLMDAELLNAQEVNAFARQMESIRAASYRDLLVLNGLCVILAAILLTWAVQSARRHRNLQERHLRDSDERAREMEVFAGRVAHDILSPLSSVSLALEMLADSRDPEVTRVALRGDRGVARVRATVDGLLEFAQAGAQPEGGSATDVVEVAQEVAGGLQESASAAGVSIAVDAERPGLTVGANRGVMMSILTNLIQNAIKYIGDAPEKNVSVRVFAQAERVHVDVRDTGPGVPPHLEHLVFVPYFRARDRVASGLGLGLATVKRLVEAHGGQVGVSSVLGRGSVFWFELPSAEGRSED